MILTCPACSTKYVVKDGAIPAGGRQVRCASCKHSWHQDPEQVDIDPADVLVDSGENYGSSFDAPVVEAPVDTGPASAEFGDLPPEADHVGDSEPALPPERDDWRLPAEREAADDGEHTAVAAEATDDFEPFYDHEPLDAPKRGIPLLLLGLIVVALLAAAFWFLAPADIKQRLGLADATGDTPLEVMVTNSDRQKLASGNELFAVSGRVINPTDEDQKVPPLRAELLDASQTRVIYSWTIAPPAATLAPGRSASFNSAEVDVPQGGSHLRVTLGGPAA